MSFSEEETNNSEPNSNGSVRNMIQIRGVFLSNYP